MKSITTTFGSLNQDCQASSTKHQASSTKQPSTKHQASRLPTEDCQLFSILVDRRPVSVTKIVQGTMDQYVAIIRGINVGGHHKVNMKTLRDALEKNKLKDVRTYIQSGNVVFRSGIKTTTTLESLFNKIIRDQFHIDVPVIVRDEKEWGKTVRQNPFLAEAYDVKKLLVTFLAVKPMPADVRKLSEFSFPHDRFAVDGKDLYLYCENGYGKTDIPNTFFEKHLKVTGTTRNWNTVMEIAKMFKV
jgi:uncharacterized protein (DUF1697 family)